MFDNVGRKIKALTKMVAWGGIVLSIILGILICSLGQDLLLPGIIIMIAGSFISWLSALQSYAFGQLVDNTDRLVTLLERENKRALANQDKGTRSNPAVYQASASVQQKTVQPVRAVPDVHDSSCIYCPKCGTKQRADRKICFACGVPFFAQ